MSLWQNISGTWRKGVLWQNVNGAWKTGTLWQNVGGTWRKDMATGGGGAALAATASPDSVSGAVARPGAAQIRTNNTTVTPTGGSAPYAYAWDMQSGWTVSAPTGATTNFSAYAPPGVSKDVVFTCTVTDAKGATTTASVSASVANYYSGGGNANLQ